MVSWMVSHKPGVGAVMKVTKYDADWPLDIPNTDFKRFYFNSETSNLSYPWTHFQFGPINKTVYPNGLHQLSTGGLTTAQWVMESYVNGSGSNVYSVFYLVGRVPDLGIIPMVETRIVGTDNSVKIYDNYPTTTTNGWITAITNNAVIAQVRPYTGDQGHVSYARIPAEFGYTGWAVRPHTGGSGYAAEIVGDYNFMTSMIWDLPADNTPIPNPTATPVSGQIMFEASPNGVKLARPGYDIRTASGRQLIMDSDRTPIKCVMMGETPAIAPGTSYFVAKPTSIDFDLSPSMVCDTICSLNGWGFAIPPVNLNTGFDEQQTWAYYRVEQGGIRFSVVGTHSVAIRFMLYATGIQGRTSGGSAVIRKVEGQYLQVKSPGSSDVAPGYNDILLDTRFAAVTVLAEGYIPASSFSAANQVHWRYGNIAARINFDSQGLFVFPKVIVDFGDMFRQGNHTMYLSPGGGVEVLRHSMATVVNSDHCIVHISPGNSAGPGVTGFPDPVGVRYYILGATTL